MILYKMMSRLKGYDDPLAVRIDATHNRFYTKYALVGDEEGD